MQDINSETNKWAEALKSIGNILFKKIVDQVAELFVQKTGIAEFFTNMFLGIGRMGQRQQPSSGMVGLGGLGGLVTSGAMGGFGAMAGMNFGGVAGTQQQALQQIILSGGKSQAGGMGLPMFSDSSTGLGKWLNKPMDKWGGTGMGYLSSAMLG